MTRPTRNAVLVLLAFWGGVWLLPRAGWTSAFNGVFLPLVLLMSMVAVIKMVRHGRFDPYGQTATMPDRLRRWVIDEPQPHDHQTR